MIRSPRVLILFALAFVWLVPDSKAQDIEPRRWGHLPIGSDYVAGAYAYTAGDITLNPALKIEDGRFDLHTAVVRYIHSFELLGKSARIDLTQAYQSGKWSGVLNGVPASVKRDGWTDTELRLAVNLFGAPPLSGEEFADYRASQDDETIVGAGLVLQLPTGEYLEDKLINLGTNRFAIRPQLGAVHTHGKWSMELTTAAWFFTDNDEFFNGKELEVAQHFTTEGHLIYTFRPGLWMSASVGYGIGSQTTVNGVTNDDQQSNLGWGLSLGVPFSRHFGMKLTYINLRTLVRTGATSDTISCGFSVMW